MSVVKTAAIAILMVMALSSALPADAEARMHCLTREQQRVAIREHRAVTLGKVRLTLRRRVPGELVRARLCHAPRRLIYLLTVLPRNGKVRRVIIDARNGAILSVR